MREKILGVYGLIDSICVKDSIALKEMKMDGFDGMVEIGETDFLFVEKSKKGDIGRKVLNRRAEFFENLTKNKQ